MKLLIIVAVVCLCSGANASGFMTKLHGVVDSLSTTIKEAVGDLKVPATELVHKVVAQVQSQGQLMFATLAQKLLAAFANLGHSSTRDVSLMTSVNSLMTKGKAAIKQVTDTMSELYQGAVHEIMDKITNLKFLEHPIQDIKDKIDEILNVHGILQSGVLNSLIQNPTKMITDAAHDLMSHFGHKRSAPIEALKATGHAISDLFSHLGSGLSASLKSFSSIAKAMAAQITSKIQVHLQTMKDGAHEMVGHSHNALTALKDAIKDITDETIKNMTPSLTKIIGSGKDAINTALHTLTGGN